MLSSDLVAAFAPALAPNLNVQSDQAGNDENGATREAIIHHQYRKCGLTSVVTNAVICHDQCHLWMVVRWWLAVDGWRRGLRPHQVQQPGGIERGRAGGAEEVQRLPVRVERFPVVLNDLDARGHVEGGIDEGSVIYQHDLMAGAAGIGEDVLQCAQVAQGGNFRAQFFA